MFRTPQQEQARKLAHVLTAVVKGLGRPEEILPTVEELGRRHSNYGVQPEHYSTVANALMWTLQTGLDDAFTPEVRTRGQAHIRCSLTMQRAAADATSVTWTAAALSVE